MVRKELFMSKKIFAILLSASMVMGLVAGCSNTSEETTVAETTVAETEAAETTEATEATEAEETEAVEVEASDIRVVSLSPEVTEIIYALGAENTLVGRSTYCNYPDEVAEIPAVGDLYAMDVEAIAAVEPTVVVASGFIDEDSANALSELGIEVQIFGAGSSLESITELIANVGSVVDKDDEAEALIAEFNDAVAAIEENVEATDVSVYYVVGFGEYGDFTAGPDTFIADIIETAGGVNAGESAVDWYISLEDLIAADPDIIVISQWMYDEFVGTAPYSDLTAVQNDNVIVVDADIFERQSPRAVEALQIIADAVAEYAEAASDAEAA